MPAYFNIITEFDKKKMTKSFVRDFYNLLKKEGVSYFRGYRKSEGLSFEQQIKIHEKYIEAGEPEEGPYYQMLFDCKNFSEVRGYWYSFSDTALFTLLIPEEDFYELKNRSIFKFEDRMDTVKNLFKIIWTNDTVLEVQTAWECSDVPLLYKKLSLRHAPKTEPFSIIPKINYYDDWELKATEIERDGIILEKDENWFPI